MHTKYLICLIKFYFDYHNFIIKFLIFSFLNTKFSYFIKPVNFHLVFYFNSQYFFKYLFINQNFHFKINQFELYKTKFKY